jgi:hypothetical protein
MTGNYDTATQPMFNSRPVLPELDGLSRQTYLAKTPGKTLSRTRTENLVTLTGNVRGKRQVLQTPSHAKTLRESLFVVRRVLGLTYFAFSFA